MNNDVKKGFRESKLKSPQDPYAISCINKNCAKSLKETL